MAKGGKGGDGGAAAARAEEQARQDRIRQGTSSVNSTFDSQFNDDYYGTRRQAYLDYASPQLEDQYSAAQKELVYALDRAGILDSTARSEQEAKLKKLYETNQRAVSDQALGYESSARNSVEDARANLISTLNSTGDANSAAQQAINRAAVLSKGDTYSPLGQLFSSFTSGLNQQAALEKAAAYGGSASRYNTGLFGNSGSVEVAK